MLDLQPVGLKLIRVTQRLVGDGGAVLPGPLEGRMRLELDVPFRHEFV